ncbi:MAG TPA: hypothetical protein VD761_00690 [Solirubrobacterales bacterium]|nr:hypothetical protein [Solirubrobacterales bacterium]
MGTGERAFNVAALARRFALMAERPALLYPEPGQRAERVLADDTKSPLDVMLIGGADEADRICAAAVAALKQDAPGAKPVLSLLSVLPADYLLGIYFALPAERRGQCETDPVWAYHLRRVPEGVADAQGCLRELAEADPAELPEQILEGDEAAAFRQFTDGVLRRSLGLPHDLSETEEAIADAGAQALADVAGHRGD